MPILISAALLCLAVTAASGHPQQMPPRDARVVPQAQPDSGSAEAGYKKRIAESPSDVGPYLSLARLQEERGAYADAEATLMRAREVAPDKKEVQIALAGLFNRRGDFEHAIAALEAAARLDPSNPSGYQLVATYYWEKAQKDKGLTAAQQWTYIFEGIAATDKALALNPDYSEALTYKNILIRMRANLETDPAQRQASIAEADALRTRAMELNKARAMSRTESTQSSSAGTPPPPPPPPGQAPLRVGGNIRPPVKIRHVSAVYPPEAEAAGISGVVILEATIAADGRVFEARVLKSIPGLDRAAVDAVRQWEFEPTYLNGAAVPLLMTVTVNFMKD